MSPWYQSQIHYDVRTSLKKCKTPSLAIYGDLDKAINAKANVAMIDENAPTFEIEMVKGVNHLMQEANTGLPMEYVFLPTSFSPIIIHKIIDWIKQQ